jgi:hypothetical protein
MNLQRFIHQHPSVFAVIFSAYLFLLWFSVAALVSFVSGWFSLSRVYRARLTFPGATRRMQSAQMRWRVNYNHVLTFGVSPQGFYMASMFLFRFMHPPLLVPWSEIRVQRTQGWMFEYVTLTMGHELAIPLRLRATLAAQLREAAANYWPIEET